MSDDKKQIGRILLKRRLISPEELDRELSAQKSTQDGVPLASRVADQGIASEIDVLKALSEQFGVPGIDMHQVAIPTEYLDLVPRDVAEASLLLPVLSRDDRLFLAMANPLDRRILDELEFVTGRKIYPYVAITTTLERSIRASYDAKENGAVYWAGDRAPQAALERVGAPRDVRRNRESMLPARDEPAVVVDEQIQEAAGDAHLSTVDFGRMGEEVSEVTALTPEFRAAAGLDAAPGISGKKILVVDDEEDIRKLVRRLLVDRGHQVLEADRGLAALRIVKDEVPDLIILDAMLPELHGFDIAKRIKGSEKYGSIPILIMSAVYRGWRIKEDLRESYGVEEYVEKPFRIADLMERVTRLLARAGEKPDPEAIDKTAAKYLHEGVAAYKEGEADLAVALLKKGITVDPLAYRLRYHLALIYGKQGLFYDGITELERAVELNPKHFPALKNLAVLYEKAGFRNKAVEMWERCVHSAPDPETRSSIKAHLVKLL